jgi:hypothetical protein
VPRLWHSAFWGAFGYGLILLAMLVPAVAFYPKFAENISSLRALAPLPVLQTLVDELEAGGLWAYIAGQQFFKAANTVGVAAAVLFAVMGPALEAQRGTLEILLARPYSRTRILLERYAAGALAVTVPIFLTTWSVPAQLAYFGIEERLPWELLTLASVHQSLLLLTIYSVTFALCAAGRHPIPIAFTVLFLTTLQFGIYMVQNWTHWSLFRLTDVQRFMDIEHDLALDLSRVLPMAAVSALFLLLAWWLFRRRLPL